MKGCLIGRRSLLTSRQANKLIAMMVSDPILMRVKVYQHGDEVGADEQFHNMLAHQGKLAEIRPPDIDPRLRAWCAENVVKMHRPEFRQVRDRKMVMSSDFVVFVEPGTHDPYLRSVYEATLVANKPMFYLGNDGRHFWENI